MLFKENKVEENILKSKELGWIYSWNNTGSIKNVKPQMTDISEKYELSIPFTSRTISNTTHAYGNTISPMWSRWTVGNGRL